MSYYMIAAADRSLVFGKMTHNDWVRTKRIWAELPSTKVSPAAPAKPDYWWRNDFTMLRCNGYNNELVYAFDMICGEIVDPSYLDADELDIAA